MRSAGGPGHPSARVPMPPLVQPGTHRSCPRSAGVADLQHGAHSHRLQAQLPYAGHELNTQEDDTPDLRSEVPASRWILVAAVRTPEPVLSCAAARERE